MRRMSFFEKKAKRGFHLHILDLKKRNWKDTLFKNLNPPFVQIRPGHPYGGQSVLENLLDLAKTHLKASTAIIEPYISTDWNSEYSAVYSRIFEHLPKFAQRIHFFRTTVCYDDLYEIPKKLRNAYLGYTVIRPLQAFRVGDTILASPWKVRGTGNHLVHCLETFRVSLLGNRISVTGMPFLQQDTTVGVCAEADLWMVARYLNKKGETGRYRPAEITSLATKTITIGPARAGLFDLQMADALRQMGLQPAILPPMDSKEAKEFIYSCVESELPVIVGIPRHVVVVIGHDYEKRITGQASSMSEAVGSFIVHDDASGPYKKMRVGSITKELENGETIEVMTLEGNEVHFFMVALPPRVHMDWKDARDTAKLWIEEINRYVIDLMDMKKFEIWPQEILQNLVIRTYLRLSSDFKHDILNRRPGQTLRNKNIIAKYKCMHMPRYIWVAELAKGSKFERISRYERKITGEIILDSTGNRHVPEETLMAFHMDGIMFVPGRAGKAAELIVEDELPYSPLLRSGSQC